MVSLLSQFLIIMEGGGGRSKLEEGKGGVGEEKREV